MNDTVAENNAAENPPPAPKQEPFSSTNVRPEIKQEAREELRPEQPVTSPSIKSPAEKKPRLA